MFIQYTLVDFRTRRPVSKEPAKNGPDQPKGVSQRFALEASYDSGVPVFYGEASDDFTPESWMSVIPEETFMDIWKDELSNRATKKRKAVERGGLYLETGTRIDTSIESQNRISGMVTTFLNNPTLEKVDFEASSRKWETITREQGLELGRLVGTHVQESFSWCRSIHELTELLATPEDAAEISSQIHQFTLSQPPVIDTDTQVEDPAE